MPACWRVRRATKLLCRCGKQGHNAGSGEGYNGRMRAFVPEPVVEALERGATIVTANERASRGARLTWDALQRDRGLAAWETARVLSWRSWLGSLWHAVQVAGGSDRMLLSGEQEHRVWRALLVAETAVAEGRRLDALAVMCADAYRRLCDFGGFEVLQRMSGTLVGDPAAFAGWARVFEQHCERERLLPGRALPGALAKLIRPEMVPRSEREIVLLGLDQLLPAQEEMLRVWQGRIGKVSMVTVPAGGVGTLVRAPDERAELRGFARWAAARLADEPGVRVALVVADLSGERGEIETVLREVLSPELEDIQRDATAAPFEFSLGRSMASEQLIRCAMDLLEWLGGPLSLERIERLLLGPGFGGYGEERAARGEFAQLLHREIRLLPEATMEQVARLLDRGLAADQRLSKLRRGLRGLQRSASITEAMSFGSWAEEIRARLAGARWAEALSSRGYQVVERWEGCAGHAGQL